MKIPIDEITIRSERKKGDIGFITVMHCLHYDYGLEFEVYVAELLANFYGSMDPSKERIWLAEYKNQIVGSIALKNANNQAQLRYFLIDPDFRGMGLGKRMMDMFMQFLQECNYRSSFLLTEATLDTAIHLYGSYGYRYVSSSTTDFGLEERRYELEL